MTGHRVSAGALAALVLTAAVSASALEAAAFLRGGATAGFAAVVWAVVGGLCVVLSLLVALREFLAQLAQRQLWLAAVAGFAVLFCGWGLTTLEVTSLNHEATQQVADALAKLEGPDFGHVELSFLGYPNRQYTVAAVPSLLMGRSITALRLGFAGPFVLAVLLFGVGLTRWLEHETQHPEFLAGFATLTLFTVPYVVVSVRDYEQVLTPITYTLFATGWLLLTVAEQRLAWLVPTAWFGAMLGSAYTPALASWGLLLVALVWLAFAWRREPGTPLVLASVWLYVATIGTSFLIVRDDLLTRPGRGLSVQDVLPDLIEGGRVLFLMSERSFTGGLLALPVLAYVVVAALFCLGIRHAVVAWWFLATVVVSVTLAGYAEPPPHLSIKRAITALPPVLAGVTLVATSFTTGAQRFGRFRRVALFGLVMAIGWGGLVAYEERTPRRAFDFLIPDLTDHLEAHGLGPQADLTLGIQSTEGDLTNLPDFLRYLMPNARVVHNRTPTPEDLRGRHVVVYFDLERRTSVRAHWPDLEEASFAYTLPAGGRQMVRGSRLTAGVVQ